mgnify:CR=1 FL=1
MEEQAPNFENKNIEFKNQGDVKEKKLRQKKKNSVTSSTVVKPTFEEIEKYFIEQKHPEVEAQKFYNYFTTDKSSKTTQHNYG